MDSFLAGFGMIVFIAWYIEYLCFGIMSRNILYFTSRYSAAACVLDLGFIVTTRVSL